MKIYKFYVLNVMVLKAQNNCKGYIAYVSQNQKHPLNGCFV